MTFCMWGNPGISNPRIWKCFARISLTLSCLFLHAFCPLKLISFNYFTGWEKAFFSDTMRFLSDFIPILYTPHFILFKIMIYSHSKGELMDGGLCWLILVVSLNLSWTTLELLCLRVFFKSFTINRQTRKL